jgi:hypothetical protein
MNDQPPIKGRIVEADDGAGGAAGSSELMASPGVINHTEATVPHKAAKKQAQRKHGPSP